MKRSQRIDELYAERAGTTVMPEPMLHKEHRVPLSLPPMEDPGWDHNASMTAHAEKYNGKVDLSLPDPY